MDKNTETTTNKELINEIENYITTKSYQDSGEEEAESNRKTETEFIIKSEDSNKITSISEELNISARVFARSLFNHIKK